MNIAVLVASIALAVGLLTGFAGAWNWQSSKVEAITLKHGTFVESTRLLGRAAEADTKQKDSRNQANKTKADHENKLALDTLRIDIKRLRDSRASSSYLPSPTSTTISSDLACFDRTELESAIRLFDDEVAGIVSKGDEATVDLNTAKRWATEAN
jgi:hypothetical protein